MIRLLLLRPALLALAGLVLAGCDPFAHPRSLMDTYVERVARVLDEEPQYSPLPEVASMPPRRQRRLPLPELDMGILDFLALQGCALHQHVAGRNSGMGRVMTVDRRLDYELRFIHLAGECLPRLEDEALQKELNRAVALKRKALPRAFWNATWGSDELAHFFARGGNPLPVGDPLPLLTVLKTDLSGVLAMAEAIYQGAPPQADQAVTRSHQRWQARRHAGRLIESARLLTARLNDVAGLIERRLERRPLCFEGRANRDARVMESVFFSVYAEKVQPYMARVQRVRQALLAKLGRLARIQQPVMPASFQPFYRQALASEGEGSLWQRLDKATHRHTRQWQRLLEQCGMRPQP